MDERTVLDFYRLQNPFPTEWPAANNSDASDDENDVKAKIQRRKSRYQALERAVTNRRSVIPGAETSGKGGVTNIVQSDEPDPLGTTDSVVRSLRNLGLPVKENPRIRNRFLLSSTSFSPALFLSQVHGNADSRDLLSGLDILTRSIDQKSASLKVLVESNFERFVKAKATIDNVYKEMRWRGSEPPAARPRGPSQYASRNSFRNSSAGSALGSPLSPVNDGRRKNALRKESEYGVLGIKTPLLDVSAKAEDVWGPALGGREKEENLKVFSTNMDRFKSYVELSASISESIKRKDHESLVEEYTKARRIADETRALAQGLGTNAPDDAQLYQIVMAARMWHDVEEQVQAFKRDVWRRLTTHHTLTKVENSSVYNQDQHLELISLLLELGVQDNPIWLWLLSRYDFLKTKIQTSADRAKVEIEVYRRRLAHADKPSSHVIASHLRSLGRQSVEAKASSLDSADIIELWEKNLSFVSLMLSPQGLLTEVIEFWQTVKGFIEGKIQKTLPSGYNNESREHHRVSQEGTISLQKAVVELVDIIREHILTFFAGLPPEDISLLFSPLPLTPSSPMNMTPLSGALSPTSIRDPRFNFDLNNLPPPSPRRGEAWEKFAFWPPWSNSISGVHYLSKMLTLVGTGAAEMASITPTGRPDNDAIDRMKTLVVVARDRCVTALCAAWNKDAENIKHVEDWRRIGENGDTTRMPKSFAAFESAVLAGMQKILYISEAMSRSGAEEIVLPPQAKLLQMVRSQYVTTLYKALSGMVENAERSVKKADDDWTTDIDGAVVSTIVPESTWKGTLDPGDRTVRMLLTLSNLEALRSQAVPSLNTQFENAFSVKLTDESKTIKDVLSQIDNRLFQSYTKPSVENLRRIVKGGITAPDWAPPPGTKPTEAKPYIYDALLSLVLIHTQLITTAPSLTSRVLSFLLEQLSRELLDAFSSRPRFPLEALMQATLDVEFVAQTLGQYTGPRTTELQGEIYQELDSRTDNGARARLQSELPEMRNVLKKLRDSSKTEFACFRKPKKAQTGDVGDSTVVG